MKITLELNANEVKDLLWALMYTQRLSVDFENNDRAADLELLLKKIQPVISGAEKSAWEELHGGFHQ